MEKSKKLNGKLTLQIFSEGKKRKESEADMLASLKKKETYTRYFKNFKFAFYCMTHPLDGYWDLTHEKRGSLAVANTILILTLVARIASLQFTSFIFNQVYWPEVNIFLYLGVWKHFS